MSITIYVENGPEEFSVNMLNIYAMKIIEAMADSYESTGCIEAPHLQDAIVKLYFYRDAANVSQFRHCSQVIEILKWGMMNHQRVIWG